MRAFLQHQADPQLGAKKLKMVPARSIVFVQNGMTNYFMFIYTTSRGEELMMQANWSLVLNVLILIGVIISIRRLMKKRFQQLRVSVSASAPSLGPSDKLYQDDIIAVRKINQSVAVEPPPDRPTIPSLTASVTPDVLAESRPKVSAPESEPSLMMFLLAKENRQLAGYELLQTLLAVGLRFGEGQLFHRHQRPNGQGPVLCSLAAATASGTFDLQTIGAFSVRGLCLFMQASGNAVIDAERFGIMLDIAQQLRDGLDAYLLDDKRKPLSEVSLKHYRQLLKIDELSDMMVG